MAVVRRSLSKLRGRIIHAARWKSHNSANSMEKFKNITDPEAHVRQTAATWGVTVEAAKAQFRNNARVFLGMKEKALLGNGTYNGCTVAELEFVYQQYSRLGA